MEENKISPVALAIMMVLGGGGTGAGVTAYLSKDHYEIIVDQINDVKDSERDLYKKIAELTQLQNECHSNTQLLKFRLDQQEKHK